MKLYVMQKVFAMVDRFTVCDEDARVRYYVEGEFLSLVKRLYVLSRGEERVAVLQKQFMSFPPRFSVEVGGEEWFGIEKRLSFLRHDYALVGLPWHVEGDLLAHDYTLYDGDRTVMRLSKHWFTWGDSYELDIYDPADELACLCVVLAIDLAMAGRSGFNLRV